MIRKSFVSLFFSSNKLQIVKLAISRKKVEVFATIDLPEGLIVNHEVKDINALSEILKKLWLKLKIKERSVGIVVPEFSTFTKILNLPKLDLDELNEAVRWQSQEYMPLDPKEMVLDWKILGTLKEEYQVLIVAIKENILAGYVNAAALAGLFPLVVEIPSISLVRMAATPVTKIIIFTSFDEIILILTQGEKILTGSVISIENAPEIVNTIVRMTKHYNETQLAKIIVGGMGLNENLLKEISEKIQVPIEKLTFKIAGMSEEDIQKYLLPISLQFKNPVEPSDVSTVNLLPEPVIKKYERKRFNLQLWGLLMIVAFIVVTSFLAVVGTYIYLIREISSKKNETTNVVNVYSKNKDASVKIKAVNTTSDKVIKILSVSQLPQDAFNAIYKAKPEAVSLSKYKIDFEKGTVTLSGIAATRDDLITFKQNLEKTSLFGQVLLPLSSFEIENNLDFELSFVYLPVVNQNNPVNK